MTESEPVQSYGSFLIGCVFEEAILAGVLIGELDKVLGEFLLHGQQQRSFSSILYLKRIEKSLQLMKLEYARRWMHNDVGSAARHAVPGAEDERKSVFAADAKSEAVPLGPDLESEG